MKLEFRLKQSFKLALVGISACLFLSPNLKATAKNAASSLQSSATNSSQFLIAQQGRTQRVQFARGRNSASIQYALVRGTVDTYLLNARARQRITVNISSVENNGVFDIIAPNGQTLKQESTNFSGTLPATGDYKIIVGGTRGNVSYRLEVSIR